MNRRDLTVRLNQAVDFRESGHLKKSRVIFRSLLPQIDKIRHSEDPLDIDLYYRFMGDWVILHRHEGKAAYQKALSLASELYAQNSSHPSAVRGLSNTLIDNAEYEESEQYLHQLINSLPENDSAKRGDTLAHLAKVYLRTGRKQKASITINQALALLKVNPQNHPEMHLAVWLSHALRLKALILYLNGNLSGAEKLAKHSLRLAESHNLKIRTAEADRTLKFIQQVNEK